MPASGDRRNPGVFQTPECFFFFKAFLILYFNCPCRRVGVQNKKRKKRQT
jgi:hypothetical protein